MYLVIDYQVERKFFSDLFVVDHQYRLNQVLFDQNHRDFADDYGRIVVVMEDDDYYPFVS